VLVHGLAGWGEQEVGTFRYFGMTDFANPATDAHPYNARYTLSTKTGLKTYVARVGPFSSLHERACELYAQIRGLRTDYGYTRSVLASHERYAPIGSSMDFSNAPGYGYFSDWSINAVSACLAIPTSPALEY
jgi:hypothetical protein